MPIKTKDGGYSLGSLRVLRQDRDLNYEVQIDVMRSGLNNNRWDYQNVERYASTFVGTPILCAYAFGQVGDGHNMRRATDPKTGEQRYSFTDPTAERIVGTIYDDPGSVWTEERDGNVWVIARGKLWRFYNPELVDKLAEQGRIDVSAETNVVEARTEADREVYERWYGLGVTILGDRVDPAVPGANIRALEAMQAQFKEMKLRAASYQKPQKTKEGVKNSVNGMSNKRLLGKVQKKFEGHRVICLSEDGTRVLMLDPTGQPCAYLSKEDDHDTVIQERITPVALSARYAFEDGVELDVDVMSLLSTATEAATARADAAETELKVKVNELTEANAKLKAMQDAETARRVKACEAAVNAAMDKAEKEAKLSFDRAIADPVMEDIKAGKFNSLLDANGEWTGAIAAEDAILAKLGRIQIDAAIEANAKGKSIYAWQDPSLAANSAAGNDLDALIARISE